MKNKISFFGDKIIIVVQKAKFFFLCFTFLFCFSGRAILLVIVFKRRTKWCPIYEVKSTSCSLNTNPP